MGMIRSNVFFIIVSWLSGTPFQIFEDPASEHLERELEQTKVHLRDIVHQYETSTAELKASNEELQAMNEELRSTTEELETSKEELQSINEELATVNQELKKNFDELVHANGDLQNLMAATSIATVFLDRDLNITRYTPSAVDIFNLIPGDIGRPLSNLRHSLDYKNLLADAQQVLNTLAPVEREIKDNYGWYLVRLLPYRTVEDRIAGVVLTLVDIKEIKRAQRKLHVSEKKLAGALTADQKARKEAALASQSKDQFLAVLSHELRTPLTPVMLTTMALQRQTDLPEDVLEGLEMIRRNVAVECQLIDELLDLSRIAHGKLEIRHEPLDLHSIINEALQVCQVDIDGQKHTLTIALNAERRTLTGDPCRLQQTVWNLVKNAAKFTPQGGTIKITTTNEQNSIVLEVRDNGIGISTASLDSIFSAFEQGSERVTQQFGGLGLGLALARATVEAHNGNIQAFSEGKNQGSIFRVTLPLTD